MPCPFRLILCWKQAPPSGSSCIGKDSCLTIPNTYSTITMPASLRSDCCSPSLRNAVRLPSGTNVRLHRNTQLERTLQQKAEQIPDRDIEHYYRAFFGEFEEIEFARVYVPIGR